MDDANRGGNLEGLDGLINTEYINRLAKELERQCGLMEGSASETTPKVSKSIPSTPMITSSFESSPESTMTPWKRSFERPNATATNLNDSLDLYSQMFMFSPPNTPDDKLASSTPVATKKFNFSGNIFGTMSTDALEFKSDLFPSIPSPDLNPGLAMLLPSRRLYQGLRVDQRGHIRAKYSFCAFCKRNGEDERFYLSHRLKDDNNMITCPVLYNYKCELCGATGALSHTLKYCPMSKEVNPYKNRAPITILKSMRPSAGIKRSMYSVPPPGFIPNVPINYPPPSRPLFPFPPPSSFSPLDRRVSKLSPDTFNLGLSSSPNDRDF